MITVTFVHPTNGNHLEVELNDSLTAEEIIRNLIDANFIPDNPDGYGFLGMIIGEFSGRVTLADAGVTNGDVLRIIVLRCGVG